MTLRFLPSALAVALGAGSCLSASAALKPGDAAPSFATQGALGGKEFHFDLADALKKGPVVLYFYPKSFTSGCTAEAHLFAEATDKFAALGATVVGISEDNIETQKKFSTMECRDKFGVLADKDTAIAKEYDARLAVKPDMADRISYVISPDGKILYEYASMDPQDHVANTMKAVEAWKASHGH